MMPADATLLITSHCNQCPAMLEHLTRLVKEGHIGSLQIINLEAHPEAATRYSIQSVPWCRLGKFVFHEVQSYAKLKEITQHIELNGGDIIYLLHLLETHRLEDATQNIESKPHLFRELIPLLENKETSMSIRIAIGALIEELADSTALQEAIEPLKTLLTSTKASVRADACYYLGFCDYSTIIDDIRLLLDDEHEEVREIAAETLGQPHDNH
jgi:thioredoxin-like negative regulator of GroEL